MSQTYGARGTSRAIHEYFLENAGREIGVGELSDHFQRTPQQVATAVNYLIKHATPKVPITVVVATRRWILPTADQPTSPNGKPKGKLMYEDLVTTKEGKRLVECEDGSVWELVKPS